jgi:hypothetical protein
MIANKKINGSQNEEHSRNGKIRITNFHVTKISEADKKSASLK